jgi:hypothetical protein
MNYTSLVYNIHTKITEIQNLYCDKLTTVEDLNKWVTTCIHRSVGLIDEESVNSFYYNNCSIEYFADLLLFSIIKSEVDVEGNYTGITYDVALSVKPYFKDCFGVDRLRFLKEAVRLLEEDLTEVSDNITRDIDAWCQNVELVFSATS